MTIFSLISSRLDDTEHEKYFSGVSHVYALLASVIYLTGMTIIHNRNIESRCLQLYSTAVMVVALPFYFAFSIILSSRYSYYDICGRAEKMEYDFDDNDWTC